MKIFIILAVIIMLGIMFFNRSRSNVMATDVATKSSYSYSGKDVFTYDILFADSPKDISTDKGEIDQEGFLAAFESFPWSEQIEVSNNTKVQSPTLSIHDQSLKQTLFISMAGSKSSGVGYILGVTKSKEGSSTDVGTVVRTQNKDEVTRIINEFFARTPNMDVLIRSIK